MQFGLAVGRPFALQLSSHLLLLSLGQKNDAWMQRQLIGLLEVALQERLVAIRVAASEVDALKQVAPTHFGRAILMVSSQSVAQ